MTGAGTLYTVNGECVPAFANVRAAFEENFSAFQELGAAVAVTHHGETVVDLWGGFRDAAKKRPWQRDTLVCMMSVSKGVSALAVHMLADRGMLRLDSPVAEYWPEFARSGKSDIPVRWVLSHLAGIPVCDAAPAGSLYDWDTMVEAIAEQEPLWAPGTNPCYHTNTMGFICGELVRRITGRSIGSFVRTEICAPLGVDFAIGLTAEEERRCAEMVPPASGGAAVTEGYEDLAERAMRPLPTGEDFNSHGWRASEVPSGNGHGTARGIAQLYGVLASGGRLGDVALLSRKTLQAAIEEQWHGPTILPGLTLRMGLGFSLNCPPDRPMGPNPRAFGHPGAGGAQGFADPDAGIGFAYACNRMEPGRFPSPRAKRLIDAVFECI